MKIQRIEIVQARTKGVTGYVNLGRGTSFGNPFVVGSPNPCIRSARPICIWNQEQCVQAYQFMLTLASDPFWQSAKNKMQSLLDRETPDGTLMIACPCNGTFKDQPCHATVIKEFLDAELARRNGAPS